MNSVNFIEQALVQLEKREIDAKAAYEQAMAVLPMERVLARRMPTDIDCQLKSFGVDKRFLCDASMAFRASSRNAALQLHEHFPPLPVVLAQSGTTTFCPRSRLSEVTKDDERYKLTDVAPLVYRGSSFGESVRWWTDIEGMVVSVEVELETGPGRSYVRPLHSHADAESGRYHWQFTGLPAGKLMDFASCSESSSGDVVAYWSPAEDYKALFLLKQDHTRRH